MKNLWFLILLLGAGFPSFAQDNLPTFSESSDPRATAILKKVKDTYETYKTLEANFTLTIEFPEQEVEKQQGNIRQEGDKYFVTLNGQEIISDGNTLWYYLPKSNEVQINIVEEDSEEILSPKALLKIYESDKYLYTLVNTEMENGRMVHHIEFKPMDRDSDYSKLRATFDQKLNQLISIKAFTKDGSRYTLTMDDITPNQSFSSALFTFNPAKYPGIHIEDLRID